MSVPDYAAIGGPAQTNGNRHYKVFVGPDSTGRPGVWHVYYDGAKEFLVSPAAAPAAPSIGGALGGGSIGAGAVAAAPAPAPAAAPPAPDPAPVATSSHPAKPNNDFDWKFNEDKNAWYYVQMHQATDGSAGFLHHYADGTTVYVAKTPPQPSTGINSGDALQPSPANLPAYSTQPASDSGHDSIAVVGATSSTGVNNADGLHNTSGFTGHATELHSASPAPVDAADSPAPAVTAIAAPADAAPASDPSHIYTVAEGDNMWNIAQSHNMTLEQLQALNPQVENPELIMPGQQINLGNGEAVVPASVASSDSATTFPETSTYDDSSTTKPQEAEARQAGVGGWTDGTNTVPNDPTHGIAAVAQVNTDPLKIDSNHSS